jgi:hypothetical protein
MKDNQNEILLAQIALEVKYLRIKLIYYSMLMSPNELWTSGEKVIICDDVPSSRLFKDENFIIYNSKGSMRKITDLWATAQRNHGEPLLALKNMAKTISNVSINP